MLLTYYCKNRFNFTLLRLSLHFALYSRILLDSSLLLDFSLPFLHPHLSILISFPHQVPHLPHLATCLPRSIATLLPWIDTPAFGCNLVDFPLYILVDFHISLEILSGWLIGMTSFIHPLWLISAGRHFRLTCLVDFLYTSCWFLH